MPFSCTLELGSSEARNRFPLNGHQLKSAVLSLVGKVDEEYAETLYSTEGVKPFCATILAPSFGPGPRFGNRVSLRIAGFDDGLFELLLKFALLGDEATVRLSAVTYRLQNFKNVEDLPDTWVGFADLEKLVERARNKTSSKIAIEFATPTVFSRGSDWDTAMPVPSFVFGGLARRWNTVSPLPVPEDFQERVEESVNIVRFRGHTETADMGNGLKKTGFVGRAVFKVYDPELVFWCQLLADSAFFTGLGGKTGWGMGCVRRVPETEVTRDGD